MSARLLRERTGEDVETWNRRVNERAPNDEAELRAWLTEQGVTGYAQSLLVMERFGYPDFLTASAEELIDGQYKDREALRPVFDAIIAAVTSLEGVEVQARKTYVSLLTPRRTFARIQATTRNRIDVGLRLDQQPAGGRLTPSRIHDSMPVQVSLSELEDLDDEALEWLQKAHSENL
ncbi:MAG TPA: DUF5655 domain-containing protein [Chloroflexota bacterium]|nr:DUF5655 domain-containing protein [Chloroflexota bacterium]